VQRHVTLEASGRDKYMKHNVLVLLLNENFTTNDMHRKGHTHLSSVRKAGMTDTCSFGSWSCPQKLTRPYGSGTVLPDSRLPQLTLGTPARFAVPVMNEFESQNKSGALPPTRVKELLGCTSIVERLATTTPP